MDFQFYGCDRVWAKTLHAITSVADASHLPWVLDSAVRYIHESRGRVQHLHYDVSKVIMVQPDSAVVEIRPPREEKLEFSERNSRILSL